MDKPKTTTDYLLLFRGTTWYHDLPPEEIQTTMSAWTDWFTGLVKAGKCHGGNPLAAAGRVVSSKGGSISDGPFAETKEAIGGYFLLKVADEEEAVAIARRCPALRHGLLVEVRPVLPCCPGLDSVEDADAQIAQLERTYAELASTSS